MYIFITTCNCHFLPVEPRRDFQTGLVKFLGQVDKTYDDFRLHVGVKLDNPGKNYHKITDPFFSCVFNKVGNTMPALPVQAISKIQGLGLGLQQMAN